ncbi:Xaa-Pro peptidase family protein [Oricola sp.]|uniref:M24 family metallopeptidase n=1 Tax=Oricola sp. TaxID=1979950 RepID=UPI0025D93EF7|nr:Xaa-Pro peptidase family protein [Oricola sp.]MCI5075806.1 Xaa-Pro peptidase family protein [Oricola sp.]
MAGPDFPVQEYENRLEAIQSSMSTAGLDALFFNTEAEIRYFTGFRTLFWQSPTRPWFLVVPRSGLPVAVIPGIGAELMRAAFVGEVRTWSSPDPDDDGLTLLVDALRPFSRIGLMMGRETSLRMPLADFDALRAGLPGSTMIDATAMVQRQRMVKSEAEIATIAEICAIASKSFAAAPMLFREGQTLAEAFRAFKIELLRNGAEDVPYLVGGAGQGGYGDVISPPSEDRLRAGDVLMLDTGATLRGYFCDLDRNFAIGHASEVARHVHDTLWRASEAALEIARPGRTCRDLFEAMAGVIGEDGGDVGRYGHGLGMQLTEPPSLVGFDETELQPGMVITLEPGMRVGPGKIMVHEENIVIRNGPAELLTERAPPDLPVIGG